MARMKFKLDRENKMVFGVCAGIGRYIGIDPVLVRVIAIVATIAGAYPWTLIAYLVAAVLARSAGSDESEHRRGISTNDLRLKMRDMDRRMAEMDAYVGSNDRLSREIEDLRDTRKA